MKNQSDVQRMVNMYVNDLEGYYQEEKEVQEEKVKPLTTFQSIQSPKPETNQQGTIEKTTTKKAQPEESTWDKIKNMINSFFD